MGRFIVRYRGAGPKPADVVERIRALPNASVVDESDRMLLVHAPEDELRQLLGNTSEWLIAPEQEYELPEKPPRIKR